jgi:transposase
LTVYRLPIHAPELNPVEGVWSAMKSGLVNLAKRSIEGVKALAKTRLRRLQYRPSTLTGFLARPDSTSSRHSNHTDEPNALECAGSKNYAGGELDARDAASGQ